MVSPKSMSDLGSSADLVMHFGLRCKEGQKVAGGMSLVQTGVLERISLLLYTLLL